MPGNDVKKKEKFIVVIQVGEEFEREKRRPRDKNHVVVRVSPELAKRYGVNKGQYQVHPLVETDYIAD